jgi:hypothetical protein
MQPTKIILVFIFIFFITACFSSKSETEGNSNIPSEPKPFDFTKNNNLFFNEWNPHIVYGSWTIEPGAGCLQPADFEEVAKGMPTSMCSLIENRYPNIKLQIRIRFDTSVNYWFVIGSRYQANDSFYVTAFANMPGAQPEDKNIWTTILSDNIIPRLQEKRLIFESGRFYLIEYTISGINPTHIIATIDSQVYLDVYIPMNYELSNTGVHGFYVQGPTSPLSIPDFCISHLKYQFI